MLDEVQYVAEQKLHFKKKLRPFYDTLCCIISRFFMSDVLQKWQVFFFLKPLEHTNILVLKIEIARKFLLLNSILSNVLEVP